MEKYSILLDCQHGFRARSCETQPATLSHELASAINSKTQIDMIVLDFSKAFERVFHRSFLNKIHHYGTRNRTLILRY